MPIFDLLLGQLRRYRAWRGGRWEEITIRAEPASEWDMAGDWTYWKRVTLREP